jgi:hypothetical protein
MADSPYSKLRQVQYRGPSTSDDYNARVEENYKDLVVLYNRIRLLDVDLAEFYRHTLQDQLALARVLADLEERVVTLEGDTNRFTFYSTDQVDNDRFDETPFAVAEASRLTHDTQHGLLTLPKVDAASLSKLFFVDSAGSDVVPPSLETRVVPDLNSADSATAIVDSSQPELAVIRRAGRIWERNVLATVVDSDGAIMTFYLKVPTDLYTTDKSNALLVHAYPAFSTDVLEIAYTTNPNAIMQDADNYTVLNDTAMHAGNTAAFGWVPPGGFTGDTQIDSGPRLYYFDPLPITGLRLKLRTTRYIQEGASFIYSYGLSRLDLRYDRFMSSGRTILRFDAPEGETISSVTDVQPQVWNVVGADWPGVFSWRALWETGPNSGTYTETPVAASDRVWIEVTLTETPGGGTPALSGVSVEYA